MIDLATALWNQRAEIRDAKDRLAKLQEIINWPGDMPFASCIHLYAFCLEFAPDLIVEVGRGYGNSTCVFTEAANRLNSTKVVSVGYDGERCWTTRTAPALQKHLPAQWFERLEIVEQDAMTVDFSKIFSGAKRILFFWDAHGLQLANYILAEVLPHLKDTKHITVVHDISDARYENVEPGYVRADGFPQFWLGYLVGPFEEVVPLYDFLSRNRINFDTPRHALNHNLESDTAKRTELQNCWGHDFPSPTPLEVGGFVYFDLDNRHTDLRSSDLVFPEFKSVPDGTAESISLSSKSSGKYDIQGLFRQFCLRWRFSESARKT